jgi:beta-galactosidase
MTKCAPLFANLPKAISDETPRPMEYYNQGYGCILYRTTIPAGPATTLTADAVHDFGYVFVDGRRVGIMDRRRNDYRVNLPAREKPAQLDILVEAMGRVNFGPEVHDHKGLHAPVKLGGQALPGWQIFPLPLNESMLNDLSFDQTTATGPAFWTGTLQVENPGDTFLDLRAWGKGVVWVNGHCLGRFWDIGPTQTAYTPGCWLHPGANTVVILDLLGPEKPVVAGLAQPILNALRPELDFARSSRPKVALNLAAQKPVLTAQFAPGSQMQEIKFPAPAKGRYFCLEALSAFDGKPFAAVGELDLLDLKGNPISHNDWTVAYVDSEERVKEDGSAENAINGQTADYWHTEWSAAQPGYPHRLVLDLGQSQTISGFRYVPRQSAGPGRIQDYRIYVGDDLIRK